MKKVIQMLVVLTAIGIISGGVLSQLSNWAKPLIAANKKAATERAIFLVQPEGKDYSQINTTAAEIYKVVNENNESIGYALAYEGNGFQGNIRLMVGLTNDLKNITALEVLDQVETPGLGTKVTETPFTSQFNELDTEPTVEWVKGVPPSKPNEIQAITGATISSKAIVEIINNGIEKMRILKEKGELE